MQTSCRSRLKNKRTLLILFLVVKAIEQNKSEVIYPFMLGVIAHVYSHCAKLILTFRCINGIC